MKAAGASNFLCASQYAPPVPPHPGPLPQGEGELFPIPGNAHGSGFLRDLAAILPLPEGEGRGEGEKRARQTCCSTMANQFCFSYPATLVNSWFRKWVRRTFASRHERISVHLPSLWATLPMRRTIGWTHDGLSSLFCGSGFDSTYGRNSARESTSAKIASP